MNCESARNQIALWVGGDLEAADILPLERHVAVCPNCRQTWQDFQSSHEALASLRTIKPAEKPMPAGNGAGSLWPSVARRLARRQPQIQRPRFNGWLPGLAVSVACVAVMVVTVRNMANAPMQAMPDPRFSFESQSNTHPADAGILYQEQWLRERNRLRQQPETPPQPRRNSPQLPEFDPLGRGLPERP